MAITLLGSGTNNWKTSGTVITSPAVALGTFDYQTGDVILVASCTDYANSLSSIYRDGATLISTSNYTSWKYTNSAGVETFLIIINVTWDEASASRNLTLYGTQSVTAKATAVAVFRGLDYSSISFINSGASSVLMGDDAFLAPLGATDYLITARGEETNTVFTPASMTGKQAWGDTTTGSGAASNATVTLVVSSDGATVTTSNPTDGGGIWVKISEGATGPQTFQANGSSTSTATSSGNVYAIIRNPAGTSAATTTVAGDPTVHQTTQSASGTIAANTTTSGNAVPKLQAAGSSAISTTVYGDSTARIVVTGTNAATSTSAGDVTVYSTIKPAAGAISLTTTVAGTVGSKQPASGSTAATSIVVGSVFTIIPGGAGTVTASSAVIGDATISSGPGTYSATGNVVVTVMTIGTVKSYMRITGQSVAVASSTGTLKARYKISGYTSALATTSGSPIKYGTVISQGYWGVRL